MTTVKEIADPCLIYHEHDYINCLESMDAHMHPLKYYITVMCLVTWDLVKRYHYLVAAKCYIYSLRALDPKRTMVSCHQRRQSTKLIHLIAILCHVLFYLCSSSVRPRRTLRRSWLRDQAILGRAQIRP